MEERKRTFKKEIHIRDYFVVLDRHKWLIIAAVVIALASTILYLKRQGSVYQAQASIIIEPKRVQEMVFTQTVQAISLDLDTQIEVIRTTPVLASVVRQLGLTSEPEGSAAFSGAVAQLRGNIKIGFVNYTKMVTITVKHPVPEKAQAIANAVAQAYIDYDRLSRLESGRDAVAWLSTQLADLKTKLRNSEESLQRFKEREGMITLDDKRSEDLEEMTQLNSSYLTARTNRLEIEVIIDKLDSENSEDLNIPVALLDSPNLQQLGTELGKLQTDLAEKRENFKDTYPGIVELKDRIRLTEQKILSELERQRDFLKAQEDSFFAQQETKRKETLKLSQREVEYLTLEREVTTNREMYNTLLSKVKELSLAGEADLNNIRIVEPAGLPSYPIGNKRMTLILGGLLGLFLGVGFAFFLEYLEDTIRTPDDVTQHLDAAVMGVVPQVAEARGSKTPPIVLQDKSKNSPAEAYRSLRTNLLFSDMDEKPKTIVITSAGPGDGKSLTAVNLAVALAQSGQNALLVDADLRRPMLHRVFNVERSKGLSTVLAGEMDMDEAVVETDIPNLSVLASGALPSNPSEVLGSLQMKELISKAREEYDIVIFDSAPVLGMTDTPVLCTEADGALLIIKTGETTRKALKMMIDQLEQVGARVFGVLLNNVDFKRDRYYYYYYYYYYYSPYGDDEEKKVRKRHTGKKKVSASSNT